MAASAIVDAGFLVALFSHRDSHHHWATAVAGRCGAPWLTCEAAVSESFYLLRHGGSALAEALRRGSIQCSFRLQENMSEILTLMQKYADVPMSLADACLLRMTEILPDPVLLTTDTDFRIYRRHSRHVVPCLLPK